MYVCVCVWGGGGGDAYLFKHVNYIMFMRWFGKFIAALTAKDMHTLLRLVL